MSHVHELLDFDHARRAVSGLARPTPLLEVPALSERAGVRVLLKLECLQVTGSFKVRGAAARLSALSAPEQRRGVVACSSGNHGRAVAWVARRLGVPATVCVPEWVDPVKLAGIRDQGAEAVLAGGTFDEAETYALALARETGRTYVSAYDDPWVIAGQGTLALEVLDALDAPPSAFLVPLSGGGLVGGIAGALRHRLGEQAPPVIAVSAERAAVMLRSIQAGHPVALPEQETLASALAGGIGPDNRHSFELVRTLVHHHMVVTEDEIAAAMTYAFNEIRIVVEGGGAVALAALLGGGWREGAAPLGRGPLVVVLSGGNVSLETLARVATRPGVP
jgi:threonine dehydratase